MKRDIKTFHATRLTLGILLACSLVLLLLFMITHVLRRASLPRPDYEFSAAVEDIILGLCVCCLALLFLMVIRVIKRVFLPLQQLSTITRAIADDPFNAKPLVNDGDDELHELRDSFMYMQQRIIDSMENLKNTTIEKEKIEGEIRVAQRIQERFLPVQNMLHERRFSLYATLEQSKAVGGDMYSYFVKKNNLYILVGDVQGNGIPAALYMASISTLFNYVASRKHSTAEICNTLNAYMCRNAGAEMFITVFIGILNLDSGILNYTNAGHPFPVIRRGEKKQAIFLTDPLDMPIGVTDNVYMEDCIQLEKGDLLLIYTDGVTESQNGVKGFYGQERLLRLVKESKNDTPEETVHAVLDDLKRYSGEANEADDLAMVSILFHDMVFY